MDLNSNHRQRQEDEGKEFGKTVLLFALILILVGMLTGCASPLEKSIAQCFALDGSPAWTKAEGVEKFNCERPAVLPARAVR